MTLKKQQAASLDCLPRRHSKHGRQESGETGGLALEQSVRPACQLELNGCCLGVNCHVE